MAYHLLDQSDFFFFFSAFGMWLKCFQCFLGGELSLFFWSVKYKQMGGLELLWPFCSHERSSPTHKRTQNWKNGEKSSNNAMQVSVKRNLKLYEGKYIPLYFLKSVHNICNPNYSNGYTSPMLYSRNTPKTEWQKKFENKVKN